ncbi:hypothetical protein FM120_16615 [Sphingobacterium faecium PCAi_F2.5]|nr:hypothetical protein FM120_16615 [Sphingobacterium faecium PCAi_F2.5]
MVAKVFMHFEDFIKMDVVTLVNEDGQWKITKSINSYK